jgi:hypothetical protein
MVPIDGGVRDVMIEPIAVYGERYIELWVLLREDAICTEETSSILAHCMVDLDRKHGPLMIYHQTERTITLRLTVPEVALTSDALFSAITVIGRSARDMDEILEAAKLGSSARSVLEKRGWPSMKDAYRTV